MKFRLRLLRRQLNHIHLVQLLLPGHGHIPRGHAGLVSRHEILQLRDLLLLAVVGRLQLSLFHRIDLLEPVVISHVAVQLLIVHMINQIDDAVQKGNVMGNQDKRVFVVIQIPFQPFNVNCVQVICGLVQKQNIRLLQKKLCQKHLGPLTARQLCHIPVQPDVRKPQGAPHLFHLRVNQIKIMGGQELLNHSGLLHIIGHLLFGCLRHLLVHLIHLRFQLKQKSEGRSQYIPDGHPLFQDRMLIQIAHPDILRPLNLSLIRLQFSGDNIHKRGFSLSVGPHQADMLSLQQPEGHIMKNGPVSEAMG